MTKVYAGDWINALYNYMDKPFAHQGRSKVGEPGGVDCVGLVINAARDVGLHVPSDLPNDYARIPGNTNFFKWADTLMDRVDYYPCQDISECAKVGDVIFFYVDNTKHVRHMGVFVGKIDGIPKMIHSSAQSPKCVCVSAIDDAYWLQRINSVWRIPQII